MVSSDSATVVQKSVNKHHIMHHDMLIEHNNNMKAQDQNSLISSAASRLLKTESSGFSISSNSLTTSLSVSKTTGAITNDAVPREAPPPALHAVEEDKTI